MISCSLSRGYREAQLTTPQIGRALIAHKSGRLNASGTICQASGRAVLGSLHNDIGAGLADTESFRNCLPNVTCVSPCRTFVALARASLFGWGPENVCRFREGAPVRNPSPDIRHHREKKMREKNWKCGWGRIRDRVASIGNGPRLMWIDVPCVKSSPSRTKERTSTDLLMRQTAGKRGCHLGASSGWHLLCLPLRFGSLAFLVACRFFWAGEARARAWPLYDVWDSLFSS